MILYTIAAYGLRCVIYHKGGDDVWPELNILKNITGGLMN
jgi:hypothetical protein